MINRNLKQYRADRTYRTIVVGTNKKGYVVLDETGNERTVQCCIPDITLRPGQKVYVKEPMGRLKHRHICGVAGK